MEFRGKTVAVTGGAGLIGSFLVDCLVETGASVIVIDDFSKGRRENLAFNADRIEIREGDLENLAFAQEALDGASVVFHLASRAYGVGYAAGRHFEILQHNERVTDSVLSAILAHRPNHVLVTSSSCVYPDDGPDTIPELPLFENEPEKVNWGYGWAKRFLEQKSRILSHETGIPVTIVRPFNIYGERYNWMGEFSQAIPMLVKRIMESQDTVTVWGSGRQRRSYVHAMDCARMMVDLVATDYADGPVNLGTEETISMMDLTRLICRIGGRELSIETDPSKPEGRFVKSADMSRFHSIVPDFRFQWSLEEGLHKMIDWYHESF
jgi:nucleoside-diphosphate-sugar epimerase